MRAHEFLLESEKFVLYINGRPATEYQDRDSAQQDIALLKQRQPDVQSQLKREVCKLLDVDQEHINEDWRKWAAGAAIAGAGALSGYQALKQPATAPAATTVTVPATVAQLPTKQLKPLERILVATATQAGLAGNELKQFLAQCAHETGNFTTLKEIGGDRYLAKRYDKKYSPGKAKELGNVKPGDGVRYKGRGFIQLTGRYNYKKAGQELGLPLEQQPELVERPDIAAKVAVWFWQHRVQPRVTDFHNVPQATKPINPGLKGLQNRQQHYDQYQQVTLPK